MASNRLVRQCESSRERDRLRQRVPDDRSSGGRHIQVFDGHSDVVAHLVLAHQTQMRNLITETNYRVRLGAHRDRNQGQPAGSISDAARQQFERPAEALVRYLLFANEAPLEEPVTGTSGFTEEFAALGPRDPCGRSLRDFDLRKRIFKYPCSYLIYSEAFDAIPGPAKEYIYRRLFDVLSGRDQSLDFASLSAKDRRAILEILVATKSGLPEEWKRFLKQPATRASMPATGPAHRQP